MLIFLFISCSSFEDDYETDEFLPMTEIGEKSDNLVISHISA